MNLFIANLPNEYQHLCQISLGAVFLLIWQLHALFISLLKSFVKNVSQITKKTPKLLKKDLKVLVGLS